MYDIIFCGGGLAAALAAWRLHIKQPQLALLIVEQGKRLGGNHTWSFFQTDLSQQQFQWLAPLIRYRWAQYEVRFPNLHRSFSSTYCSTDSEMLHQHISTLLPSEAIRTATSITAISASELTLSTGETLSARCIIDCRGPGPSPHLALCFQKFTGQVVELTAPHNLPGPIIMDATVAQENNYRFLYTLPLTSTRVLVEDTRYSNTHHLDTEVDRGALKDYIAGLGWQVATLIKEEQGVLPITLGGDIKAFWDSTEGLPRLGLRAALFHATTGYSLPNAVQTAELLTQHLAALTSSAKAYQLIRSHSIEHFQQQRFLHFLNRMLFMAAKPDNRYVVMQRFYRLQQALVERFHAGKLLTADKMRILIGRPPVPITAALRCLPLSSINAIVQRQLSGE